MYFKLEVITRSLLSLFHEARGDDPWDPYLHEYVSRRCVLCGAREYPYTFPWPYEWPRLYGVVTSVTGERGGRQVAITDNTVGAGPLYLPTEDAEMLGDTTYAYAFCRYHGRPETVGWVDYQTNCLIEWFPERPLWQQQLFNLSIQVLYTLWTAARFLWSLLTLQFIHVRFQTKRHAWLP